MRQRFRHKHGPALFQVTLCFMGDMFLHVSMYTLTELSCQAQTSRQMALSWHLMHRLIVLDWR